MCQKNIKVNKTIKIHLPHGLHSVKISQMNAKMMIIAVEKIKQK